MIRKSRSSVFIRYALSYIAVVLLLFFSIAGYLYVRLSGKTREEIIDNQINRLSRIAAQHESYISAMLNTAEETTFKMTFTNIRGGELAIRDNVTGTVMNITPDAEYFFTAGAYTNEERFEIVGRQEMPTEMETVESQQAVKAVYNVQGQYMGETTEWNALPHGVYVVDGVKMVK